MINTLVLKSKNSFEITYTGKHSTSSSQCSVHIRPWRYRVGLASEWVWVTGLYWMDDRISYCFLDGRVVVKSMACKGRATHEIGKCTARHKDRTLQEIDIVHLKALQTRLDTGKDMLWYWVRESTPRRMLSQNAPCGSSRAGSPAQVRRVSNRSRSNSYHDLWLQPCKPVKMLTFQFAVWIWTRIMLTLVIMTSSSRGRLRALIALPSMISESPFE